MMRFLRPSSTSVVRMPKRSTAGCRARSIVSRPVPSGEVKASRMKKVPVSRSQNWLLSEMLALSAASSVVSAATMPGRSAQLSVRTKLAGIVGLPVGWRFYRGWPMPGQAPPRRNIKRLLGSPWLGFGEGSMGRLEGKIAIISGGATGMGGAASKLFAAEGAKVAIVDRNEAAAAAAAKVIRDAGGDASHFAADVSDEAQVIAAVKAVDTRYGAANVLFNHAGTIVIKPFLESTLTEWDWLHADNVRTMFLMTRAVLPGMIAQGGGSIVCTSSISAVAGTPMEVLYDTTKGAVHMFARAIAVEFRDRNIRCNAVCPGFIRTPHGLREVDELQKLGVAASAAAIAAQQGRIGEPEEVARAALFLASDEASFVNGTQLFVDTGFTAA